jgi:hypothetical protein
MSRHISGSGGGEFANGREDLSDRAAPIAMHAIERGQGAVVGALGLGAAPQVSAELGFLFLNKRFGNSGFSAVVMAAQILPEFLVDAAHAQQFPIRIREFFDEDSLVGVRRLVRFRKSAEQFAEILWTFARKDAAARGGFSMSFHDQDLSRGRGRLRNSILQVVRNTRD